MRLSIIICLVLLYFPSLLDAKTIVVDKKGKVTSLQAAVAMATPGDTVLIKPGTYREGNLIIKKSMVILGEDYPVFDGENKFEIFTIHASNVTVRGLKFIDTGKASMRDIAAIKVLDSKFISISDNIFSDSFFGIHFSNSSQSRVENNQLIATAVAEYEIGNGIHMWKCNHITIHNNQIRGHRDGIYFEFVTESVVKNVSSTTIPDSRQISSTVERVKPGSIFPVAGVKILPSFS